ncbi:NACHT domain-containing NTPase [Leptolyngbya sp. 'hensonii']|uniref:NACHT domain-containing protein n=1 Tax=Leptolyngbya sp. 'hensonii' TaxID=1922337 RepID=UPI00209ADC68|nr:NACHT domain-containing NTPase [Leptolyngbya sp. 'hensonii']
MAGRPVDKQTFKTICSELSIKWEEVAELESGTAVLVKNFDLDSLVQMVRERLRGSIHKECGSIKVLGMNTPINLESIYINVNILEKVTRSKYASISELQNLENFDRIGLASIQEKQVSGEAVLERYDKLMIWGKPGAGKTTFLHWIATKCNLGQLQEHQVPILLTLRYFAAFEGRRSLLTYITEYFLDCGIQDLLVAEQILSAGRALVLLDGLDEVSEASQDWVLEEIRRFAARFHRSTFVMTCRIAASDYNFQQFTEVEVADFDELQIKNFSEKWFQVKDPAKMKLFMQKLRKNKPIKELATCPLLLTLLCLVFQDAGDFPVNRSELYQQGLDVLLKQWDAARNIERYQTYKKLSLHRKEDLLSHIALVTFERNEYFFPQKVLEKHIRDYICNLSNINNDPERLKHDSEAILQSIEAQHGLLVTRAQGIYSFSHQTFQEYLTAKRIVSNSTIDTLSNALVPHVTNQRWREIFLLTIEMLSNAGQLLTLMKHQIDQVLAKDEHLQNFLTWVNHESRHICDKIDILYPMDDYKRRSPEVSYKPAAIRAFYFALVFTINLDNSRIHTYDLGRAIDNNLAHTLIFDFELDFNVICVIKLARDCTLEQATFTRSRALTRALENILKLVNRRLVNLDGNLTPSLYDYPRALTSHEKRERALDRERIWKEEYKILSEFQQSLQELSAQLPESDREQGKLKRWWQNNGQLWLEQFRHLVIKQRNYVGRDWQFSDTQQAQLQQYYEANKLLVECLRSHCYVEMGVRQELEDTLLLPRAEIEKRVT